MLAADGMPVEKIALLLRIKTETVLEVMATKQAHIEKCDYRVKSTYPKICAEIGVIQLNCAGKNVFLVSFAHGAAQTLE